MLGGANNVVVSWAVTEDKIDTAVERIVQLVHPRRIILFGSAATGAMQENSDIDLLIVTDYEVSSPRKESVRIRSALRGIRVPMDLLIIGEDRLRELADQPGMIYREALRHGHVVYESPT
ncbi:MAG: nucleotidyltransferase domain-containing protein [Egibacteraceae bacterium]